MKFINGVLDRWSTPSRDRDWEELWGEQKPVESVKPLFSFFLSTIVLAPLFIAAKMFYFASFTVAITYLVIRLRTVLFAKARVAMNQLEPRDYAGIWLYEVPVMIGIWILLGALLKAILGIDAGVN
ncbi:hypothetical protein N8944_05325 [Pseudomonadales bacterium]|nr:hypothetical protein [Pseudomonadales bacterium]